MMFSGRSITVAQLYRLTILIGLAGTVVYSVYGGFRPAVAFALGVRHFLPEPLAFQPLGKWH